MHIMSIAQLKSEEQSFPSSHPTCIPRDQGLIFPALQRSQSLVLLVLYPISTKPLPVPPSPAILETWPIFLSSRCSFSVSFRSQISRVPSSCPPSSYLLTQTLAAPQTPTSSLTSRYHQPPPSSAKGGCSPGAVLSRLSSVRSSAPPSPASTLPQTTTTAEVAAPL